MQQTYQLCKLFYTMYLSIPALHSDFEVSMFTANVHVVVNVGIVKWLQN